MNLDAEIEHLLLEEHSKSQVEKIISWVGHSKNRMEALMNCFFDGNLRLCQRASWPLIFINQRNHQLLKPYLERMVFSLESAKHDAVIRNTIRLFVDITIPEDLEGLLLEKCFIYLNDPKQPGAIRAFSIKAACKIIIKYPELKEELIVSIEDHMLTGSKAFKSAGRQALKQLY